MDKLFVDDGHKAQEIDLPKHGTVKVIVQDGKVIRFVTETSQKFPGKQEA